MAPQQPARLVTVYIPTRNRPALALRAVRSVLAQSYQPIETIVVDDGSSTESFAALEAALRDLPVRLFRMEQPVGACRARNHAIENAAGDYVTGLDDDDYFLPDRVRSLVDAMAGDHMFVCSNYLEEIEGAGTGRKLELAPGGPVTADDLLEKNVVGSQVLAARRLFTELGCFDPEQKCWQDYELWLRLALHGVPGYKVPEQNYVVSLSTGRERISNSVEKAEGILQFLDKYGDRMSKAQRFVHRLHYLERSRRGNWIALLAQGLFVGRLKKTLCSLLRSRLSPLYYRLAFGPGPRS